MDADEQENLKRKIAVLLPAVFLALGLLFFVPAGTTDYWEAWVYCAVLLVPFLLVLAWLLKKDPELLARRLRLDEKEPAQKRIVRVAGVLFLIGLIIPGLDHRYGWSDIPVAVVLAADVLVILGYTLIFLVLRENPFASRVVDVEPGQTVIATGPYAMVRHPMYLGASIMWLATPVALGSLWALPFFFLIPVILVWRILNEEEVLLRELPGYREYVQTVRYRLVPGIW
ncbi:MAG TPA: isoprenylcysteine carboxylmethyltransferase family protein [Methanoregula sp.]|nr:isoprenylcysteine carboxylmethyltransferase family protein [Methanoregula sp.]